MSFSEHRQNGLLWETADLIPAVHAFTTRYGGASSGIWSSLNLGFSRGDDPACVAENFDRLCAVLGIDRGKLCFTRQVHGTEVRPVTAADAHVFFTPVPYEADGLVTDEPGVALICFVADCVPILLCDPVRGTVGAVHAGWKGTAGGIAGKAVQIFSDRYGSRPEDVRAAIGPHIGECCYETGPEVAEAMRDALGKEAEPFCVPRGEKFHVDLGGLNRAMLLRAGLTEDHIALSRECTMCHPEKFWSHRYTKGRRGVQAAVILRSSGGARCGD
jgi:YfiH family protein